MSTEWKNSLRSRTAEEDFGVLVDEKLDVICLQPRRPTVSWTASKEGQQQDKGDHHPLFSHEVRSGVLCPGLGPPAQESHGVVGVDPEEGHRDDPRAGAVLLMAVEVGLV